MSIRRWLTMAALVLGGESIYMLPYMRRTFQTSLREVIQVSNTELGFLNSMFGILALLCYFPGGWLADRVSPRHLLTGSLLATSLGGLYMATFPSYGPLLILHAFWGVVSILTFWAPLVKATRGWGGKQEQGLAFGVLDGGRGLVGALLASAALGIFALFTQTAPGLRAVILLYSAAPLVAALGVWLLVPEQTDSSEECPTSDHRSDAQPERQTDRRRNAQHNAGQAFRPKTTPTGQVGAVLCMPVLWLLAVVVLASYMAYIGTFDFAALAEDGFGQTKVFGAQVGAFRDWLRPLACVGAGILADRFSASGIVSACFALLAAGCGLTALGPAEPQYLWLLWLEVFLVSVPAFALRGVYYALLHEAHVPQHLTGTAVGVVSVLGFTPDVFAHPLSGWFLDTYPGASGFQRYFGVIGGAAVLGLVCTWTIRRLAVVDRAGAVSPDRG